MTRLLDAVRRKMVFGMVLDRSALAFSQPTQDGLQLAFKFINTKPETANTNTSRGTSIGSASKPTSASKCSGMMASKAKHKSKRTGDSDADGDANADVKLQQEKQQSSGDELVAPLVYAIVAD